MPMQPTPMVRLGAGADSTAGANVGGGGQRGGGPPGRSEEYLKPLDEFGGASEMEDHAAYWRGRYYKKNGERYPLWCDDPAQTLRRGLIPANLLRPEDIQGEVDAWIKKALEPVQAQPGDSAGIEAYYQKKQKVSDAIKDLRAVIANYNLPYLSLPAHTDKSVALNVFINMNTNSKPLSTYDIIVAEVKSVMGRSLHDLKKEKLANNFKAFLSARAKFVCEAAKRLAEGHQLSVGGFYSNV
jgi:hypothetical protein